MKVTAEDKETRRRSAFGSTAVAPARSSLSPCLLVSLSILASGCDLPGKPSPSERYLRPDDVLEFSVLFQQNCVSCHGTDGRMGPGPPLNDDLFRAIVPTEQLVKVISEGRRGTMMPAFARRHGGTLTNDQIRVLADEIKGTPYSGLRLTGRLVTIRPTWGVPKPVEGVPPYVAEEGAAGNRETGAQLFESACANCHGDQGLGYDKDGRRIQRINDVAFLALNSDQLLRRIIITGRSDLGMPNYASDSGREGDFKPLTSRQIDDLVALLAYWRQGGTVNGK